MKRVLVFIGIVIILVGGISAPRTTLASILLDRVVAVVNKEVITWSELYKAMEMELSAQARGLTDEDRANLFKHREASFLEQLIDMKLQLQEAQKIGLKVRDDEIQEAIEGIKKKYQMSDDELRESLAKEGLTFEEYRRKLSEQILISQFVTRQIRNKIVVTDEQVKRYIEKQGRHLGDEDEFRIRQIFFRKPKNEGDRVAIEEKALSIVRRLKAGEDFVALAWEYSEDPSAKIGSDLGYLKKSDMAREFVDTLETMKVGDVSKPFWTEQGLHIIKLEEKMSGRRSKEEMDAVRAKLEQEAFEERYRSTLKALRERALIEIRL